MRNRFERFIEATSHAIVREQVAGQFAGLAEQLGFTSSLIIDPALLESETEGSAVISATGLDGLAAHCRRAPFREHPFARYAAVVDTPFDLASASAALGFREAELRSRLVSSVQDKHIVVFPVHRGGKLVFYAACAGDHPDDGPLARALLHASAHAMYDMVISLAPNAALTRREADCLSLLGRGHTYKAIGWQLRIAERTVRAAVASARRKLHARTRSEVVARVSGAIVNRAPTPAGHPKFEREQSDNEDLRHLIEVGLDERNSAHHVAGKTQSRTTKK